jgi:hypothetical protein
MLLNVNMQLLQMSSLPRFHCRCSTEKVPGAPLTLMFLQAAAPAAGCCTHGQLNCDSVVLMFLQATAQTDCCEHGYALACRCSTGKVPGAPLTLMFLPAAAPAAGCCTHGQLNCDSVVLMFLQATAQTDCCEHGYALACRCSTGKVPGAPLTLMFLLAAAPAAATAATATAGQQQAVVHMDS